MKQKEIFEILKMGESAFLTGPAGCGKTFMLNKYINYLKDNNVNIGITASTGIAATHIDGRTIHSWCGMGINESLNKTQMRVLLNKGKIAEVIRNTKVLIIDEISMLSAKRLDLVDHICKSFRADKRPFGGIQVILCGDFFQLPPVARGKEDGSFVIKSNIWNGMNIKVCYFEEQHRQNDKRFLSVLNDIRESKVSETTCKILEERLNKTIGGKIKPTKLYTHNSDVSAYNSFELNKLNGEEVVFNMRSEGVPHLIKVLKKNCLAPETLKLKVDAIVMFVRNNFNKNYVNGTLGRVIRFDGDNNYPVIKTFSGDVVIASPERWVIEEGGLVVASIGQVPLRLAWAITVHKSQGMSMDCAEIDLSRTFEYGMGYVALSRVRSLTGIKLTGINKMAMEVNKEIIELDKELFLRSKKDLKEFNKINKKEVEKIQDEFIERKENNNLWQYFK